MSTMLGKADLALLDRMRKGFLEGTAGNADYWTTPRALELYDLFFAQRIGWKWDAVLRELHLRQWAPPLTRVVDWGCGTGIAGRSVLSAFPTLRSIALIDRSPAALAFAAQRLREKFPDIALTTDITPDSSTLLVVSHVLNELPPRALQELLALFPKAGAVLWVESGARAESRRLSELRAQLMEQGLSIVAPCPHQGACGMLQTENEHHWCHHFTAAPSHAHQDPAWSQFSRQLGIDLRSLPYSFLVLQPTPAQPLPAGVSRVIGYPRSLKGHDKVLACREENLAELTLQKRDAPDLLRHIHRTDDARLYQWETQGTKITSGRPLHD